MAASASRSYAVVVHENGHDHEDGELRLVRFFAASAEPEL